MEHGRSEIIYLLTLLSLNLPMNQFLTGMLLSFVLLSCGTKNETTKEKPQAISLEKPVEAFSVSTKVAFSEIDTSIYNQYKDGKKEGLWKELDKNGQLTAEGYYKNGKANGWMKWYHKGSLMAEGNMINDKRNGPWRICDVHDPLFCIEANFKEESREGLWKIYHENGTLYKEQTWKEDRPIAEKCWDDKGNVITCE